MKDIVKNLSKISIPLRTNEKKNIRLIQEKNSTSNTTDKTDTKPDTKTDKTDTITDTKTDKTDTKIDTKTNKTDSKNDTIKNTTSTSTLSLKEIFICLKNYNKFYGCGAGPMSNVISLIAGICLFITSKIKINF